MNNLALRKPLEDVSSGKPFITRPDLNGSRKWTATVQLAEAYLENDHIRADITVILCVNVTRTWGQQIVIVMFQVLSVADRASLLSDAFALTRCVYLFTCIDCYLCRERVTSVNPFFIQPFLLSWTGSKTLCNFWNKNAKKQKFCKYSIYW